ncbi:hypothetical protein Droror1_Dr00019689 [Drosera rotundifolia]
MVAYMMLDVRAEAAVGENWGTQATYPLPASIVVGMLKDNGIQKVKLFEADGSSLNALSNSGIEVMVGIPNDLLSSLASDYSAAQAWVSQNVSKHISSVDIRYVAPWNELFLSTYNGTYLNITLPAV